jgi:hypothetical protein
LANTRRTFQKNQREMEKKRKAEQKRNDRLRKKDAAPPPAGATGERDGADRERENE